MTLATVPQANPNDELTDDLINQGPNALRDVVNGQLDDTNIATLSGSKITAGTLPTASFDPSTNPETRESEIYGNFVASGNVWSIVSGLNGTMTAGVAYVNGKRLITSAIASYAFTASKDTYVYIDSSGNPQYSPQTNGAALPATPANNMLIAKVVTNGSAITSIEDLRVTGISDGWRAWTPTLINFTIGTGGDAGVLAMYKQVGKIVYFRIRATLGTSGQSVGGTISFTLPVVPKAEYYNVLTEGYLVGKVKLLDALTAVYHGDVQITTSTTANIVVQTAASTYVQQTPTNTTIPFTWGAGDMWFGEGFYEAE